MSVYNLVFSILSMLNPFMLYGNAQYNNMGANVRHGSPIGVQEYIYRGNRFPVVKKAQEDMLNENLSDDDVLEIAFSCSGGGWRAMCCSAGFISGADKIGLLDSATYISSLSGSTWLIGPWIYSGSSIEDYRRRVINIAAMGINIKSPREAVHLLDDIFVKLSCLEDVNIIDFYGALLANTLLRGLGANPHKIYLSEQRKVIDSGKFPMPIYTAILAEKGMPEYSFEFTPYEVGSRWNRSYIPIWAFGRRFDSGKSINNAPEQYMGFMLGIFGSAFAASFREAYSAIIEKAKLPSILNTPFTESTFSIFKGFLNILSNNKLLSDIRLFWAKVPNYVYNYNKVPEYNSYRNLKLADAGVSMNNPVFAAYRKPADGSAPDIIFVFDSSPSINFDELKGLCKYAKENNIKFPEIKEYKVDKHIISVFMDESDVNVPAIVYMPIVNGYDLLNKSERINVDDYYKYYLAGFNIKKAATTGFAATFNFNYTKKQAETLIAMTEFNLTCSKEVIKQVMRDRILLKRKLLTI